MESENEEYETESQIEMYELQEKEHQEACDANNYLLDYYSTDSENSIKEAEKYESTDEECDEEEELKYFIKKKIENKMIHVKGRKSMNKIENNTPEKNKEETMENENCKEFGCLVCNKFFNRKDHLQNHLKTNYHLKRQAQHNQEKEVNYIDLINELKEKIEKLEKRVEILEGKEKDEKCEKKDLDEFDYVYDEDTENAMTIIAEQRKKWYYDMNGDYAYDDESFKHLSPDFKIERVGLDKVFEDNIDINRYLTENAGDILSVENLFYKIINYNSLVYKGIESSSILIEETFVLVKIKGKWRKLDTKEKRINFCVFYIDNVILPYLIDNKKQIKKKRNLYNHFENLINKLQKREKPSWFERKIFSIFREVV